MTDELSSEQEAAVRRLLAQARHDEPVPSDVAARLDDVLEGLVADEGVDDLEVFDSGSGSGPAPADASSVTELAGVRRRRRNVGRLLLAAAAVIIGGVTVGQTLGSTGGESDDDAGSAADSQAAAPREGGGTAVEQESGGDTGATEAQPQDGAANDSSAPFSEVRVPVQLSSENFAADVQRELLRNGADRRNAARSDFDGLAALATSASGFVCADGEYGPGAKLPAYYDAEAAVLVLRRPQNGLQRVDLLTCGTAFALNSVELPAP